MPSGIYIRKNKMTDKERKLKNCEGTRTWYKKNKNKAKNTKLMKAYGLSIEGYNELEALNDSKCIICDSKCPSGRRLAVDHDHKDGTIRGLLCINCNKGLGNFKDNIQLLKEAIEYLEFFEKEKKNVG